MELVHYNPATGLFARTTKRGRHAAGPIAGCPTTLGYLTTRLDGKLYYMHRLAFLYMTGCWPDDVDHKNGNVSDNRWDNLRSVGRSVNLQNIDRARKHSRTGLLGVDFNKSQGKFRARIQINKKPIHLGYYLTAELAHAAYLKAKDKFHPTHIRLRKDI